MSRVAKLFILWSCVFLIAGLLFLNEAFGHEGECGDCTGYGCVVRYTKKIDGKTAYSWSCIEWCEGCGS